MPTIRKPIFVRPLNAGAITTGNEVSGKPAAHLKRLNAIGLVWRSSGSLNLWIRGDMGASYAIDFVSLIAANAQPGTTIRVRLGATQAEVDGTAPYDSGAVPFISPAVTRESGLYHSHLETPSVQTARWWRIDIAGHTGDFEASSLVLGRKIEPSHFYNYDHEYGAEDFGSLEITRYGVFDEEPGVILRTVSFQLAWQSEAEWESSFRPLIENLGRRGIIYCCFDPEPTAYRQARTYMGVMRKTPFARGTRKNRTFAQDFDILSLI